MKSSFTLKYMIYYGSVRILYMVLSEHEIYLKIELYYQFTTDFGMRFTLHTITPELVIITVISEGINRSFTLHLMSFSIVARYELISVPAAF